ncbi:prephenate dehydratase [Terribacillus sp. 7520-G]|uniref:prephenate dehydratase n=1 Tax=Terribacillus TaxID=459532 RepID=UPI000BA7DF6A|nr:prephenate dehydratase [Terribacillus sp. 7520-G]PAD39160.1 prephenate dehydratase [Terribacillus sp. 7520-G]
MKISYLGPKGTFTKMAVDALFPDEEAYSYATIPQCMDAVANGEMDYCVVPVENTIEGTVPITMDYLIHQVQLPIIGEIVIPIRQHLLTNKKLELRDIETVYSHSHAIAQCHQFLHTQLPQAATHATSSTGTAAEMVAGMEEPAAAIGNELAAKEFGLTILQEDIHDYANNHTRFFVLARPEANIPETISTGNQRKTSLYVTLPHDYAGALHQVLAAFAWRKINMSKIESRPMKTGLGNYFFIMDVTCEAEDILFQGVQQEIAALGCSLTVLGSYPIHQYKEKAGAKS